MPEGLTPELVTGFRDLLGEFRGVGEALGEVLERTARLETKVDHLVVDVALTSTLQERLCSLERWVTEEVAARAARGHRQALWIAAIATIVGGGLGAVIAHFWK